ncbi:MAG: nucleoside/nucleotide kinase family protein [Arachnia sp.]
MNRAGDLAGLAARARDLAGGSRAVIGIAGAPGSGKSSLAAAVAGELGEAAVVVPMDGFHLAQAELERLGRADRKGAPDTFDADGFVALVHRLRHPGPTVYAPRFDRAAEEPIAGAIPVNPEHSIVLLEGNYLLLEQAPWQQIPDLLDETWFVAVDPGLRVERLIARHISFGRSAQSAREWVLRSDESNAALVAGSAHRATRQVDCSAWDLGV